MFIRIWKFRTRPERASEFRRIYGPEGDWAMLFHGAPGYLGTELIQSSTDHNLYATIDRWENRDSWEDFLDGHRGKYAELDKRCGVLTVDESELGTFVTPTSGERTSSKRQASGMSTIETDLLAAFELHSVERIRTVLDGGLDPREPLRGKPPVNWFTEMYTRSDRFPECLRLLLDRGAVLDDPVLGPVLLDDPGSLTAAIRENPSLLGHRVNMVSAFTPLAGASLLHVAAEYGHARAARVLIDMGADVDARAAVDEFGLNGHTPLFHTVNSNGNRSEPVMRMLIDAGARCDVRLSGITWGKGFEWETTCFDVTPVSYAQLGLLPQMHRTERDVYANVRRLLEKAGCSVPPSRNVPNKYLKPPGTQHG